MKSVGRAYQLRGDSQAFAGAANRAFEDVRDTEFGSDDPQVFVRTLVGKRPCAGYDQQVRYSRKGVEDFLGESVGEPFLVLLLAKIGKRQYGDRFVYFDDLDRRRVGTDFVEAKLCDSDCQYADDDKIQPPACCVRDRLRPVDVFFALEALWCQLKRPRED